MKADNTAIPAAEIRAACELILTSGLFRNAPRLSHLLSFLVEKAISRDTIGTSEYAIGVAVFGRPHAYNTGEDPIVRVQIGRLRKKLKIYYARIGVGSDIEMAIPLGCYMPVIQRINIPGESYSAKPVVEIGALKCVSEHEEGVLFTLGLHEELVHHLHKTLGGIAVINPPFTFGSGNHERQMSEHALGERFAHRLEGCVQIDTECVKTSIRLVDISNGYIAWSEQFNRDISLTIAFQEELAMTICDALKKFIAQK